MQEQDLDAKILILSEYFPKVKNEEIKKEQRLLIINILPYK